LQTTLEFLYVFLAYQFINVFFDTFQDFDRLNSFRQSSNDFLPPQKQQLFCFDNQGIWVYCKLEIKLLLVFQPLCIFELLFVPLAAVVVAGIL
jgi:hypothetical protein